jgi:hypothetical protein
MGDFPAHQPPSMSGQPLAVPLSGRSAPGVSRCTLLLLIVPSGVIARFECGQHFADVNSRKNQLAFGAVIFVDHHLSGDLCHAGAIANIALKIAKCFGVKPVPSGCMLKAFEFCIPTTEIKVPSGPLQTSPTR